MTSEEIRHSFGTVTAQIAKSGMEFTRELPFFLQAYVAMFAEYPHIISVDCDGTYLNEKHRSIYDCINDEDDEDEEYREPKKDEEPDVYTFESIDHQKSMINITNHYRDKAFVIRDEDMPIIIGDHITVFFSGYSHNIYVLQPEEYLSDEFKKLIVDNKSADESGNKYVDFISCGADGYTVTALGIKKQDVDLSLNYNDDLPDKEIKDFLKSSESGLIMLHGVPGSGKSSYIRHLIHEIGGRHFMYMHQSMFGHITDAKFVEFLLDNKNMVIVMEDCEDMLTDRVNGNGYLSSLLNISDGVIGDSLKFKFICTFNADTASIDKALMRKGRMRMTYEFKPLVAEKTKKLAEKLGFEVNEGDSLTLAEIYNHDKSNGAENDQKQTIGF